jgi:hypothetical protein
MTTKEQNTNETLIYDVRLTERNLRSGKLDAKEFNAYLNKLPDDEARAEFIEFEESTEKNEGDVARNGPLTFTSG